MQGVISLLNRVRSFVQAHGMLTPGDRVIVAVSGGPDSVTLLHVLHRLALEWHATLHVFHLNHGLRGAAADEDAQYVKQLAERLSLASTVVTLGRNVLKYGGGSIQARARGIRMHEIENLTRRIGATKVAVGHNRDDQAETVLMRFLRGSGPRGLAGILPVRQHNFLTYIRPLLDTPRTEIEEYCRAYELSPRTDESNSKSDYLRNRLRLELIPHLVKHYNPALSENLVQLASVLQEEDRLLDKLALEALRRCLAPGGSVALVGTLLLKEPVALARRVVRLAARDAVSGIDLGLPAVTRVLETAANSAGTTSLDLPGGLRVANEYGIVRFYPDSYREPQSESSEWPVALIGETIIPELGLRLTALPLTDAEGPLEAAFDLERLPGPLVIRFRRQGDRLWPSGMEGSKKLQDILVDAKIPQRIRDRLPLLVSGSEVLWVIGHRLDRRFLATGSTQNSVLIRASLEPHDP